MDKSTISQETRVPRPFGSNIGFVDYIGLECVTTTCTYDPKPTPFFFLFADVDTKQPEQLRLVLQHFARAKLSFYWYQTDKGWHVVSPCLLPIKKWDRLRKDLAKILDNYYRNLVIRIENKEGDSSTVNYSDFNQDKLYEESVSLHLLFKKRFNHHIDFGGIVTNLLITKYTQLREIDV